MTYKIQCHHQAEPNILYLDKLMPYYPNFREELHSWILSDHPTQYRDQEAQTDRPVLQSQPTAAVDIPPQISDPITDPAEQTRDSPHPVLEPAEMDKANTTKPTETAVQPAVLETMFDSTSLTDRDSPAGLSTGLETEAAPTICPEDVPDRCLPLRQSQAVQTSVQRSSPQT